MKDEGKRQRYPVISIVLYFGDEPWNTNRTLKEQLTFPDWTECPEGSEEKYMRRKGYTDQEIILDPTSTYAGLAEADAKSCIAMADEEMKGVTA